MTPNIYTRKRPYIGKMLDVSTSHITENDAKLLDESDSKKQSSISRNPLSAFSKGVGWLVNIPATDEEVFKEILNYGYSNEFVELVKVALNHDCDWINLDCDGAEIEDLPKFDW
jgi:hypothetical protein